LLERLVPVIREGVVSAGQMPFDDPMSLYEDSPQREWKWLRAIWAGRARVDPQRWRLYFVVMMEGSPIGMQDLIGTDFAAFGTVSTFSWLQPSFRRRGLGTEMRSAILHLAFDGLDAREASSEALRVIHGDAFCNKCVCWRHAYVKDGLFLERIGLPHSVQEKQAAACIIPPDSPKQRSPSYAQELKPASFRQGCADGRRYSDCAMRSP
jgi:GNAT superfamily N-acetyltransferase